MIATAHDERSPMCAEELHAVGPPQKMRKEGEYLINLSCLDRRTCQWSVDLATMVHRQMRLPHVLPLSDAVRDAQPHISLDLLRSSIDLTSMIVIVIITLAYSDT